jgi:hypothetical protein
MKETNFWCFVSSKRERITKYVTRSHVTKKKKKKHYNNFDCKIKKERNSLSISVCEFILSALISLHIFRSIHRIDVTVSYFKNDAQQIDEKTLN